MFDISKFLLDHGGDPTDCGSYIQSNCVIHGGDNPTALTIWPETQSFWCFTHRCCENTARTYRHLIAAVLKKDFNDELVTQKLIQYSCNSNIGIINNIGGNNSTYAVVTKVEKIPLWYCDELRKWGYSKKLCLKYEVGGYQNRAGLITKIAFCIYDRHKNLVGYTFRLIEKTRQFIYNKTGRKISKWVHSKGLKAGKILYGECWIDRKYDHVVLLEGAKDVIFCLKNHIINPVATLGIGISKNQEDILIEMGIRKIYIIYDNDSSGNEYYKSKKFNRTKKLFDVQILTDSLPYKIDIDELLQKDLKKIIEKLPNPTKTSIRLRESLQSLNEYYC